MKQYSFSAFFVALAISSLTWAAPVAKYSGAFEFPANFKHKSGVSGTIQLMFEGDQFKQVLLHSAKAIYGQVDFPSTEQALFSNTNITPAVMATVFKLEGPTHDWYYVMVMKTSDKGKNFTGEYYKATGTIDEIKKILDGGSVPSTWDREGKGNLVAQ